MFLWPSVRASKTDAEIFFDGELRKNLPALRHQRDAGAGAVIGGKPRDILLAEHDRAARLGEAGP